GRLPPTTRWPMLAPILSTTTRASASAGPPGGKGTINRIGLLGYASAARATLAGVAKLRNSRQSKKETTDMTSSGWCWLQITGAREACDGRDNPRTAVTRSAVAVPTPGDVLFRALRARVRCR